MSGTSPAARRRLRLLAEDPHCFWCGRDVQDYDGYQFTKGEMIPDDLATLDHVNQRYRQKGVRPRQGMTVLACFRCNQRRSVEWQQQEIQHLTPCEDCGRMCHGRFCSQQCWVLYKTRNGQTSLTWEERSRMEHLTARRRERRRRYKRSKRIREASILRSDAPVPVEPGLMIVTVPPGRA